MEDKIVSLIKEKGPLTGSEILDKISCDTFTLWKTCLLSKQLAVKKTGIRFLRLDRRVEGFARLSPSILREFLTYSIIGLAEELDSLEEKVQETITHIRDISKLKIDLARKAVSDIMSYFPENRMSSEKICVILAGDIVYGMSHNVPRPERSTGKMVNGSDLDLIFVLDNSVPDSLMKELDETVYRVKYQYLVNPPIREEIDYIVKKMDRVEEQLEFDSFKKMVACKILKEGILLFGSTSIFEKIKNMLDRYEVAKKLDDMFSSAGKFRQEEEKLLLSEVSGNFNPQESNLFYTAEESEEFE